VRQEGHYQAVPPSDMSGILATAAKRCLAANRGLLLATSRRTLSASRWLADRDKTIIQKYEQAATTEPEHFSSTLIVKEVSIHQNQLSTLLSSLFECLAGIKS